MSQQGQSRPRNLPLIIGSTLVVVGAIVAIAVGVNGATNATAPPTATAVPTPSASPTPEVIAFADCSTATFGPALPPLNPPTNVHKYSAAPPFTIDASKLYKATITTSKGAIVLCLQPDLAAVTVNNFVTLARNHFYDGIPFHRVVASFVVQGGDPDCINNVSATSCGQGGPGFSFRDEPVHNHYVNGCVAMANSGPNSNGSQFFICIADEKALPPKYNLFGKAQSGLDVALKIAKGDLIETVTVSEQQ